MSAQIRGSKVGLFETFINIGEPGFPGEVNYSQPQQKYTLTGSGANIWNDRDSFSFLSQAMKGDFILQARIKFSGEGHEPHRKAGIMFRESMAPDAAMVACTIHGDGLTSLQYRKTTGSNVEEVQFELKGPEMIQLEKKGNVYIMSVAPFGEVYQRQRIDSLTIGNDLQAGLFICSHNDDYLETVEFSNVRLYNTAPDDLVQYEEYLGSYLEIMDIETGHREVVGSSAGSWQAPNWTPSGKTLIYNADGLLYNFDIVTGISTELNTGFATGNNNDHVLTFDGTMLGISHHDEANAYQSSVYTLPVTGGTPKEITTKTPSYLHGWSPDNQYLVYTAERKGNFDIYRIPAKGGKEIRLTSAQGLDDGSEYSPDGKYIYFCSTRTGTMQIWRMEPDGKNQTQLTFDDLNDWFPHVSPDNKWLVFVSFPADVPANDHPFYKRVYLRLMPIDGGKPKVIAYLYGGQGSMNVPSWSPNSKKIAFVSNGIFVREDK